MKLTVITVNGLPFFFFVSTGADCGSDVFKRMSEGDEHHISLESAYKILATHFPLEAYGFEAVVWEDVVVFTFASTTDRRSKRIRYVCRLKVAHSNVF
jgi:hypothetical protein